MAITYILTGSNDVEDEQIYESFSAQKMANSYPAWTRVRNDESSLGRRILSAPAIYLEDIGRYNRSEHYGRFAPTVDACNPGIYYYTDIPSALQRNYVEHLGEATRSDYYLQALRPPSSPIDLTVVNSLEVFESATPTRLSDSGISHTVGYVIESEIGALASATIQDIEHPNWLHYIISDGTSFGDTADPRFFYPTTVYCEGLLEKDTVEGEGRMFFCNDISRTTKIFADIESIDVDNIDSTAKVIIDPWGFSLDYVLDRSISISVPERRTPTALYYKLETTAYGSALVYCTRETDDIHVQRQGFSSFSDRHVSYLLDTSGTPVTVHDIAKMDMDHRIYAVSDNTLYVFNSCIPAVQLTDTAQQDTLIQRTSEPHVGIETVPLSNMPYRVNTPVTFRTRLKFPISSFTKPVRCRFGVKIDSVSGVDTTYFLRDGSEAATAEDAWRYGPISERGTSAWSDLKWTVTFTNIGKAAYFLETQFLNKPPHPVSGVNVNRTEFDVIYAGPMSTVALAEIALPNIGTANGITFDHNNDLWIKTDQIGAHKINMHYDVALFDYDANRIYFRENYDSVIVSTTLGGA